MRPPPDSDSTPGERAGAQPISAAKALGGALVYSAAIGLLAYFHELWRDEGRALNIARQSHSLADLFKNLANEGHPALWYLILYAAVHAAGTMLVLKPVSGLIATAAMFVFFRWAPWPAWQKALFAAGLFPLYEYSVICRNYGVAMLLLFAVAVLYRRRFTHPLPLAVALALLANTNAYALIAVFALALALVIEWWLAPARRADPKGELLAAALVFTVGVSCSVWVMYPDRTSAVTGLHRLTWGGVWGPLVAALLVPGHFFFTPMFQSPTTVGVCVLAAVASLAVTAGVWTMALRLMPRVWLSAALLAAVVGGSLLSDLVYPSSLRHWGMLYMLLVVLLWVEAQDEHAPPTRRWAKLLPRVRRWALPLILVSQVVVAVGPVSADLFGRFSSSESLGAYLSRQPELRDAEIIGEPDFLLEALPYYAPNPIYLPREDRYLLKVNLTSANRPSLSLDELMSAATELHARTGRPVLIAMGHDLRPEGPYEIPSGAFHNTFTYSPESLRQFLSRADRLARFEGAANQENYILYRWAGTD
jgi:hypothetical protein